METQLLYLHDSTLTTCQATIIDILQEQEKTIIILDQTIFYPQGGGQPFDKGTIQSDSALFHVQEVRFVDGIVRHIGTYDHGVFAIGETVTCLIDQERRALHSRLHSAGHIVDMAVASLKLPWTPGKGFHFPEGPYVEYSTADTAIDKEKLKQEIETHCNIFSQQDVKTEGKLVNKEELAQLCRFVPANLPHNKPVRVMMYGNFGVPCGGTHVANLHDIGPITIRKIRCEGNTIRVSYELKKH